MEDVILIRDHADQDRLVEAIGATRTTGFTVPAFFGIRVITDPDVEEGIVWLAVRCARGMATPCSVCAGKGYVPVQRFTLPAQP